MGIGMINPAEGIPVHGYIEHTAPRQSIPGYEKGWAIVKGFLERLDIGF